MAALPMSLLAGCTPVDGTGAPCAARRDAACPTGFHCGDDDRCAPGERPVLTLAQPTDPTLKGLSEVALDVISPQGVGAVTLQITTPDRAPLLLKSSHLPAADGRSHRLLASVQSWLLPAGEARLEALVATASPPWVAAIGAWPLTIPDVVHAVTLEAPARREGDELELTGLRTGRAPVSRWRLRLQQLPASGEPSERDVTPTWESPDAGEGRFTVRQKLEPLTSGTWLVSLSARDAAGADASDQQLLQVP